MKTRHAVAFATLFAASLALAQAGKPYASPFSDYRPYADAAPGDWRALNQAVTAQAGGAHDHGAAKDAAAGGAAAHDHGAAGGDAHKGHAMHRGMDHDAMQKMHRNMDPDAMKRMHGKHMQGRQDAARDGHAGHGAAEKKP